MIYLNLLPSSEKKIFRLACIEKIVNFYIAVVLAAVVLLVVVFAGAKYFLLLRADILGRSVTGQRMQEIEREILDTESMIRDFNFTIGAVQKIRKQEIGFYDILADLAEIVPDGVAISDLSYNFISGGAGNFVLGGKSGTREEFLIFMEKLEKSPYFKEINSPLSNVVKKENINFRIEFALEK